MGDLISDGHTRVAWATTIANIDAPTVAECNAANDWTSRVTPDGLKTDPTTADVDTSSLASTFSTTDVGRVSYDVELTFKRGDLGTADDAPYTTLKYGTAGYLIIRRGLPVDTAWAAGQIVEVYPVKTGEPANVAPAANEVNKFTSVMKVIDDPATAVAVAA